MPELPDVELYREALVRHYGDAVVDRVSLRSPFVVRTAEPELFAIEGRRLLGVERLGKRLVWQFDGELFLVLHLMIAGRLHQKKPSTAPQGKNDLAAFHFMRLDEATGAPAPLPTLMLTEASQQKRASIHMVAGRAGLAAHDPGGIEPLTMTLAEFRARLTGEHHTLKRSLADPRLLAGIGNAYGDEILHAAQLSPVQLSTRLNEDEIARLYEAVQATLAAWTERLRAEIGDDFPEKVTAFRPEMAVHGKFGQPCPACGTTVQRIRYAANETNYCPRCQTGGKLLADRSLSRLLKGDWPTTVDEWEQRQG
ncbi:MAG: formamidopyrimidine-DNA glycosylase [Planctomycetaceae bacterium]|nr:formamidopyrimidine-DNA glycosylase [Planctomycetaceae bacterium]